MKRSVGKNKLLKEYLEDIQTEGFKDTLAAGFKSNAGDFKSSFKTSVVPDIRNPIALLYNFGPEIISTSAKAFQVFRRKELKHCGVFSGGQERAVCIAKANVKALQQQKSMIQSSLSKCSKDKDPQQCRELLNNRLKIINSGIQAEQRKVDFYLKESKDQMKDKGEELSEFIGLTSVGAALGTIVGGAILNKAKFYAYRAAQAAFSQAARECGTFDKSQDRKICIHQKKYESLQRQYNILKSANCQKQKDPIKCKETLDNLQKKMEFNKDAITIARKQQRAEIAYANSRGVLSDD